MLCLYIAKTTVFVALLFFCIDKSMCLEQRLTRSFAKMNSSRSEPVFKEYFIEQFIDHFNFRSLGNSMYKQRYLLTVQYWRNSSCPIFYYTGNEKDITNFQKASGFLTDLAVKMDAMVVFAEHRYYGKSLPFGDYSFSANHIGFLTMEQALADFAYLIQFLKQKYKAENAPVIAFGGSYGGQLAAYLRMKYPNLVEGSLASSAALYWLTGFGNLHGFWESITETFKKSSASCLDRIQQGFAETARLAAANHYNEISRKFKTCKSVTSNSLNHLYGWARNSFAQIAMVNYPYPTDFLAPLPGHPVHIACKMILEASSAIDGLVAGVSLFYNETSSKRNLNSLHCFDIMKEYIECADPTGCGLGNDAKAWDYQACTEEILPGGTNNETDMFPPLSFTMEMRKQYCQKKFDVTPRDRWLALNYWTEKLKVASNIIFSNGDLDPWCGGGVLQDISPSLIALKVTGGAHHLDLRGSNPDDPPSVIEVRNKEAEVIARWIAQYWMEKGQK